MPHARRSLDDRALRSLCEESFQATGPDRYGIEAEWPTYRLGDPSARLTPSDIDRVARVTTRRNGRITFEPGGQVELSTAPAATIGEALEALADDESILQAALDESGCGRKNLALDGDQVPRRVLEKARYVAMERFFAAGGSSGAWMMNNTASTQVNLSHDQDDAGRRWATLNRIAPVLIAAFANSPGLDQRGRSWVSLRQAIWWSTDPARTRPVRLDSSPCAAWLDYALSADVAFICAEGSDGDVGTGLPPGLAFARWAAEGHELGWPTADDFRYHLSMLFPPVRPRGWLELRVLDALPEWIRTCACVVVAAAGTSGAGAELAAKMPDPGDLWVAATREGVRDPRLGRSADALLQITARHLDEVTSDADHHSAVAEFTQRFVSRRRMPGDDGPRPVDLRACDRAATVA